jgi:hypothetical protein
MWPCHRCSHVRCAVPSLHFCNILRRCARGQNDTDVPLPLQAHQGGLTLGGGGSPRTPIQSASTPMWLGDLPYWKVRDGARDLIFVSGS